MILGSIRSSLLPAISSRIPSPPLIPREGLELGKNTMLTGDEILFLNHHLPDAEFKCKWRPLFNSKQQGESFAKFSAAIQNQGPTLIIVFEEVNLDLT